MHRERWGASPETKDHAEGLSPVVKRRNKRQLDKTRAKLLALAKPKACEEVARVG